MAKRRYKRRRKTRGNPITSFLTFCIIVGAIIASVTVFLKVADIEVSGVTRYDPQDIIKVSGIEVGDNMFAINKFEVATKILERYPYIGEIKIRRRLPDTFTFEITERVPAAYIESDGNRWLIDSSAYILEFLQSEEEVKLPKITGGKVLAPRPGAALVLENQDRLSVLKETLAALKLSGMTENISRIEIEKLYDIKLVYANRFMVSLGDFSELPRKIEMLSAVVEKLSEHEKGTINVSAVKEARFKPDLNIDLSEKPLEEKEEEQAQEETIENQTSEASASNENASEEKKEQ